MGGCLVSSKVYEQKTSGEIIELTNKKKDAGKENYEEVELKENVDYGDISYHSVIEGDRRYHDSQREFADAGFTQQEWNEKGEIVDSQLEDNYDDSDEE